MKSKNAKLKFIIILVVIIIIAIVVAVLFFFTDVFRTKRGAFFRYFKTTSSNLEILKEISFEDYERVKESTPYIVNGEMTVRSSSNIADSSIMDKLKLKVEGKVNNEKEKANYNIKINSNNTELFDISLAKEKNMYAFYSSQISNAYIGIKNENLKQISQAIFGDTYVPNEITKLNFDKILEVSKVEKSHIDSYYNLLKNSSPDTAFSKKQDKIEIDGQDYSAVTYTLKLENKESANVQDVLLTKLIQDSIMMDYLTSRFKLLNMDDEYTDINTFNIKMREKIENLKSNPDLAENIEISISEHRQKNIRTTVKINDWNFGITHIKENNKEVIILELNGKTLKVGKEDNNIVLKYSYEEDDINKSIEINSRLEGTIEENNIKNIMEITTTNGIKVVNYYYEGSVNFTNDIGTIETFDENNSAILNNYSVQDIVPFIKQLKNKINNTYISKGASIGINLDPIFKNVE